MQSAFLRARIGSIGSKDQEFGMLVRFGHESPLLPPAPLVAVSFSGCIGARSRQLNATDAFQRNWSELHCRRVSRMDRCPRYAPCPRHLAASRNSGQGRALASPQSRRLTSTPRQGRHSADLRRDLRKMFRRRTLGSRLGRPLQSRYRVALGRFLLAFAGGKIALCICARTISS